MRLPRVAPAAVCALVLASTAPPASGTAAEGPSRAAEEVGTALVAYRSGAALQAALAATGARLERRLDAIGVAEVRVPGSFQRFARAARRLDGIGFVRRPAARAPAIEPALAAGPFRAGPFEAYEWQWFATRAHAVPEWVLRAASAVTIAVVDTGADLSAPDLSDKAPSALDIASGTADVADRHGHGTFVATLAAGSVENGEGIAGAGGDARLLVIRAGSAEGGMSDLDTSRAIVEAVDRGARVVNLSFGGPASSPAERKAVAYAAARGVLLVAAVGNGHERGNAVEYPAALLQPPGSRGAGGVGLAVAASTAAGGRAPFSSTGTHVSLAAPGEQVFSAVSELSSERAYPRVALPGSGAGLYGFGSGTSYAAPQVAGAAALVWAANPTLSAAAVAAILEETAAGAGWSPELGHGVLDVAAAVARAAEAPAAATLSLDASRRTGVGRLRVQLVARLGGTAAGEVVLRRRTPRGGWRDAGRAVVDAGGAATWGLALGPGTHRFRARLTDGTLASATVAVTVRTR